jgi:hypothetical protein
VEAEVICKLFGHRYKRAGTLYRSCLRCDFRRAPDVDLGCVKCNRTVTWPVTQVVETKEGPRPVCWTCVDEIRHANGLKGILENKGSLFGIPPRSYEQAAKEAKERKPMTVEQFVDITHRAWRPGGD